ncbi:lipopolysaccharide biosynthesis protein [Natronogracilivirga saccharolytica]|uniref:Oligosaccharide flippase family protein n=1 Tax=Natronogracilivirga saccharolytica TaxID=2812953 RepID=A0A8J7UXL1_9BACT|nr:polysaccharide biosynthesis C-terminal domain-containing protein [Natronogracilivirga saccharolytica]MBP3193449.1 oligosaccharide flippase family protein [Natronogracilivirga saccharolytica]
MKTGKHRNKSRQVTFVGKLRELFSDTLVYGISSVLARFINYLLVPFYTKYFDPAAYGIIGLIFGAIVFLNVLFTFGMESSYLRYGADREKARNVFKTIQLSLFGGASLLVLVTWIFMPLLAPLLGLEGSAAQAAAASDPGIQAAAGTGTAGLITMSGEHLFYLMLAILWLDALCMVPFAELRLIRKSYTYAFIRLFNVIINVCLNVYLVVFAGWGIEAVLVSNAVASFVTMIILAWFTRHMYQGKWDTAVIKRALWFGLPYIPAGISHAVNEVLSRFAVNNMPQSTIDRLYGSHYNADDITGIFNACIKISVFMLLAVQMFRMAWLPFFMRQSGSDDARKTFAEVFTWFNIAAAVVYIGVGLFVEQIVQIRIPVLDGTLIDERYWMGLYIVPWLLLAYWFQGWFLNFMAGVFIREKMWHLSGITIIGALITLAGNMMLVPVFGMQGAVWVAVFCFLSMAMLMYVLTQSVYKVPYKIGKSVAIVLFSGSVVALGHGFATDFFEPLFAKMVLFILSLLLLVTIGMAERRQEV